jgi:hypothetical protein
MDSHVAKAGVITRSMRRCLWVIVTILTVFNNIGAAENNVPHTEEPTGRNLMGGQGQFSVDYANPDIEIYDFQKGKLRLLLPRPGKIETYPAFQIGVNPYGTLDVFESTLIRLKPVESLSEARAACASLEPRGLWKLPSQSLIEGLARYNSFKAISPPPHKYKTNDRNFPYDDRRFFWFEPEENNVNEDTILIVEGYNFRMSARVQRLETLEKEILENSTDDSIRLATINARNMLADAESRYAGAKYVVQNYERNPPGLFASASQKRNYTDALQENRTLRDIAKEDIQRFESRIRALEARAKNAGSGANGTDQTKDSGIKAKESIPVICERRLKAGILPGNLGSFSPGN